MIGASEFMSIHISLKIVDFVVCRKCRSENSLGIWLNPVCGLVDCESLFLLVTLPTYLPIAELINSFLYALSLSS